tara:strand:- start:5642 stop:6961 length:1320 start_codon:yes stop_codon:yes gene_type:complete
MDYFKNVVVVGGGYTGLAAANELSNKGLNVTLIEKTNYLGGLGKTIRLSNGFQCEAFYHHFFTQDNDLINYSKQFLNVKPEFNETKMSIFFKGKNNSWNGISDLIKYPHINLIGKIRFLFATLLLSKKLINNTFLDNTNLSNGLLKLYGKEAFASVWEPMIKGKFGNKVNAIPLRWMEGRLKQRIDSRKRGKEKLGFLKGSLSTLTKKIVSNIKKNNSDILTNTLIEKISYDENTKKYNLFIKENCSKRNIFTDKIIFTTTSKVSNSLIKNLETNNISWLNHKYFTAYCVVIELTESLSEYYWTNIADKELFFCGYIEQSRLTGKEEYGGLHLAYLTKYVYLDRNEKKLSQDNLKKKAYYALKELFPEKKIEQIVRNMYFSISDNAQVVTDFNFKETNMELLKMYNLFLGNMSNVYPDERSINNAIKVGKKLAKLIIDK